MFNYFFFKLLFYYYYNIYIKKLHTYTHYGKILGTGLEVSNLQPAQCNNEAAAKIGPFFNASDEYAIPKNSPFNEKLNYPLFIFKHTPNTPSFLNLLPYYGPDALLLCRNYPKP